MKKTIKAILIVMIMIIAAILLTGCGKEKTSTESNNVAAEAKKDNNGGTTAIGSDKIVATMKLTEEEDMMDAVAKYIIYFDGDVVSHVESYLEFEDEETAQSWYALIELGNTAAEEESEKLDVELEGKSIKILMDAEEFADDMSDEEMTTMTKAEIAAQLEEEGFTVEK